MAESLVGTVTQKLIYSRSLGQFQYADTKKIVTRDRVLYALDQEVERTSTRLQGFTRLMASGKIDLAEWQNRMAEEIKSASIRMAAFGAGGKQQLTQRHYGYVGKQLYKEYQALDGFAQALAGGKLTQEQALRRAAMYAESTRISFFQAEKTTKENDSFLAKRSLQSGAEHCPECLGYDTQGQYIPVPEIVPIGTSCSCRSRCRCFVTFKRSLNSNLLASLQG